MPKKLLLKELSRYQLGTFADVIYRNALLHPDREAFICGLSNISFGLPQRPLVNRAFLTLAMKAGLNAAILDPLDKKLMSKVRATAVLLGQDPWCQAYTAAFREGKLET